MIDAPRQLILDDLARPSAAAHSPPTGAAVEPTAAIGGGYPFEADLETVRFVKERASARRRLYYVTFDATWALDPRQERGRLAWIFEVERDRGSRRMCGDWAPAGRTCPSASHGPIWVARAGLSTSPRAAWCSMPAPALLACA